MKCSKIVTVGVSLVLLLLVGQTLQAQSQVSRKSSRKVLKQDQKASDGEVYQEKQRRLGEVERTAKRENTKEIKKEQTQISNGEGHPGKGHAYGKYKNKKGKAFGKYKNKQDKGAKKAKVKAGKRKMEKRKVGKAYNKSRKAIPVQGN